MDDEDRVIRVEDVDDLQEPPPTSLPHDQELVVAGLLREWRPGLPNHHFRLFPTHSVLGQVVAIPVDPPKLHGLLLPAIVANWRRRPGGRYPDVPRHGVVGPGGSPQGVAP